MVKKKTKGQHRKAQLQQQNQQQEQRNHHKQAKKKKKGKSKQNIGNQRAGQQKDKETKVKIPKKIESLPPMQSSTSSKGKLRGI